MSSTEPRHTTQTTDATHKGEDPTLRRLLLCEVLLEEYEAMDQPQLDAAAVAEIRAAVKKYVETCGRMDDQQRTKAESGLNGEMVSRLYKLMSQAQKRHAETVAETAATQYEAAYRASGLDETKLPNVVDYAVVSRIFGHSEELYDHYLRKFSNIEDEIERQQMAAAEMLDALREEAIGDNKDPKYGLSLRGTGDGGGKTRGRIDRPTAVKNAAGSLRSALCLSGGGIRSATFNLGILQGLARHGLLEQFDYLSTVSGGGFIGGWLSAWIHRRGLVDVIKELKEPPKSPLKADPDPIEHLRIYSNYLSPQPGLLSADTWTLFASVLRNLLLNWLVFIPVLLAFLMIPRLWTSILLRATQDGITSSLVIGSLAALWALLFIAWNLPSANDYSHYQPVDKYKASQRSFIAHCLLCLVVSAIALALFCWLVSQSDRPRFNWYHYVAFAEAIIFFPWTLCVGKIIYNAIHRNRKNRKSETAKKENYAKLAAVLLLATVLIGVAQAIMGYAVFYAAHSLPGFNPNALIYPLVYAILSVPIILTTMALAGSLIAGFASRFTNDDDQEWWARTGAWISIVIVAWGIVNLLVLFGPLLLLTLGETFARLNAGGFSNLLWSDIGKVLGTITGVISGIVTLLGGFSAKTPANDKEAQKASTGSKALSALTALLAPIFLGFVFILISLASNWLLISPPAQLVNRWLTGNPLPTPNGSLPEWHIALLRDTPFQTLIVVILVTMVLGVIMGRLINTNAFSLQYLWRNRIIRAYLGASHRVRRPDAFTGFDTYDNVQMHELRPQPSGVPAPPPREGRPPDDTPHQPLARKLFHVLNIALNLTGGKKLQWQDRRAESFSVSPLHAGSYWLGYRRSFRYGASDGISLGAAIAISGAFVSPNMGFMMTSPIVRFLMALFNVRFGWWLGNPGPAGDETNFLERILNKPLHMLGYEVPRPFRLRSPRLSIIPYVAEAFGSTDDDSPYVYLSDGGHFENLGLYEMVLRRCRFIVVSDASTDPDYSFQSLATSIRQIRVDLGVPIDIPDLAVGLPSQDMKSKYCAIGKIRYSCVDRNPSDSTTPDADYDGVLIFIKPSLIGSEPRDVINYWQGSTGFPQEVITDQWFSEAQFESYRALGSYIIHAICDNQTAGDGNKVGLVGFAERVKQHNRLNFRAFQNQISYLAFEEEFKASMTKAVPHTYKQKVKKFMDDLFD